jgi:hypothetical protein
VFCSANALPFWEAKCKLSFSLSGGMNIKRLMIVFGMAQDHDFGITYIMKCSSFTHDYYHI